MKTIFIIFILLIVTSIYLQSYKCENFINNTMNNNIDFYIITLGQPDRLENINFQNTKLNANIIRTDAVNGQFLNQNELLNSGELSQSFYNGELKRSKEIGCYKSHYNIYNLIKNNPNKQKYSIVLEDDFNIIADNITEKIESLLNSISELDFDIIFLGNTFPNYSDKIIKDNIHSIDKNKYTIGTFAYLLNNKNINKIINVTKVIDSPIDNKLDTLIKNDQINAYVIYPNLINYKIENPSSIN